MAVLRASRSQSGLGDNPTVDVRSQPTVGFGRPVPLAAGLPASMGPTSPRNHDVAPEDSRFVAVLPGGLEDDASSRNQIVIVQNWFEELRRLVPTN